MCRAPAVGTVVTFRWSDPGLQSGDVYIVSIDGAPRPVQREGILVVDAVDHGRVCASVVVSRDGKSGRPSAERCVDRRGARLMVPLRRLNRHRSAIVTAAAVGAVVAIVGGIAVTSGGYTEQRIDLGDAAVWVANDDLQSIGRASTAAFELNSLVATGGGPVEVAQAGSTVLMLDPDRASVDIIDVTTSSPTDQPVAVPPDQATKVALAGSQVVVSLKGDVWTSPIDEFADFDADAEPATLVRARCANLRRPGRQALRLHAEDRGGSSGRHGRRRHDRPELEDRAHHGWARDAAQLGRRHVGGARRRKRVCSRCPAGRSTSPDVIAEGDEPVLQTPSAEGNVVVVAHRQGLVAVGVDDGVPRTLVDDVSGTCGRTDGPRRLHPRGVGQRHGLAFLRARR